METRLIYHQFNYNAFHWRAIQDQVHNFGSNKFYTARIHNKYTTVSLLVIPLLVPSNTRGCLGMACMLGVVDVRRPVTAAVWSQWVCSLSLFTQHNIPSM